MNNFNIKNMPIIAFFAILMGIAGGITSLVTILFLHVLHNLQHFLWDEIPSNFSQYQLVFYTITICTVGGVLVGIIAKKMGDYPKSLETNIELLKKNRRINYKHLDAVVLASLASLGFGASLGPEAAFVSLLVGMGSIVADVINNFVAIIHKKMNMSFTQTIQRSFKTSDNFKRQNRSFIGILLSIIATFCGYLVFHYFYNGVNYFHYEFLSYDFSFKSLWIILPVVIVVFLLGIFYTKFFKFYEKSIFVIKDNIVATSIIAGLFLGLSAAIAPLVLFSGHEGIQSLIDNISNTNAIFFLLLAIMKVLVTAILISTHWRGGQIFPIMFAGSAVGISVAILLGGSTMAGLASGMGAIITTIIPNPILIIIFLLFVFPINLYPAMILGVFGGVLMKKIMDYKAKSHA